jgi:glycosyltransferase involved in cell wall biosynthesis
MKIGVMLRHWGQPGGIGIYTANIMNALLQVDQHNQYLLMYRDPEQLGLFADRPNVQEMVLHAPTRLLWDQVAVPRVAQREKLDMVYNPKLSIPLFPGCKTVLASHGGAHFVVPQAFPWYDRLYFTIANHLYFRRADAVIAMTELGAAEIVKYMGIPRARIHAIHESYNERCHVLPREETEAAHRKYNLPEQFILWVGGISPLKNFGNILRGFAQIHRDFPHRLVVAGFRRWKFSKDLHVIDELGLRDAVQFTDYVPPEEIPALYNLASAFVFPSIYEGFGLPILEAMACGCPVITSQTGYAPEVAGRAAILVNPYRPDEIGTAIRNVLSDPALREELMQRGLEWVKEFSWMKTAAQTMELFETLTGAARQIASTPASSGPDRSMSGSVTTQPGKAA